MYVLLEKRFLILVGSIVCRSGWLPQRAQNLIVKFLIPLIAAHFGLSPKNWLANCHQLHIWLLFAWSNRIKPLINRDYERVGSLTFGERWRRRIWLPSVLGHPSQVHLDWSFWLTEQVKDRLKHGTTDAWSGSIEGCPRPRWVINRVYAQVGLLFIFDFFLVFSAPLCKHSWSLIKSFGIFWRPEL